MGSNPAPHKPAVSNASRKHTHSPDQVDLFRKKAQVARNTVDYWPCCACMVQKVPQHAQPRNNADGDKESIKISGSNS